PVAEELKKRGNEIFEAASEPLSVNEVDATIIASVKYLNPGLINKLKRPIFSMPHTVAVVKTTLFQQHTRGDHMLMTGPIWKERMEYVFPKYKQNLEIGYPKGDELAAGKSTRNEVIDELGLDPQEPIVMFAPSWDDPDAKRKGTMDALPQIEALGFKNLLVCPHDYDKMFNELSGKKIIKNPNKNRYLLAADLMIGDMSGIMIEFAVLDKPMVQIDMYGDKRMYGIWEEPANHYGTFQIGEFATPDSLPQAVKEALNNPNKYRFLRDYWKWRSFYNLGSASKAAADAVEKLTSSYEPIKQRRFFFF
ncbi:MAG: CDP-glycerol glycerophosphotransferase family protein, partial [bacterium]